jgi:hypothetical protein
VPFVDAVCIVIAEDTTVILYKHMRQQKGEVIFHDLVFRVHPNLLPKYAYAVCAPEPRDIIGIFAEIRLPSHC